MSNLVDLPKNLDINHWIIFGLKQTDEISRLLALEEMVAVGIPRECHAAVQTTQQQDPSQRCRELAQWALALEKAKERILPMMKSLEPSPEGLKFLLEDADPSMRYTFLHSIRKAPSEALLEEWRSRLLGESAKEILEIGLTLLAKFGRESDAELAMVYLSSEDPEVVCAALDVLQQQSPEIFKERIADFLISSTVSIRLHAIKLLRAVDARETLLHLREFIKSPDPLLRQKALRELLLTPFEHAESYYLNFLGVESYPLLLVMGGLGIVFNPLPHLPLKLFDILFISRGVKKHILQLLLNQTVDCIHKSGILKEPIETFVANLKERIQRKKQEIELTWALRDLEAGEPEIRMNALQKLQLQSDQPHIAGAVRKAYSRETDPEIKSFIESFMTDPGPAPEAAVSATPVPSVPSMPAAPSSPQAPSPSPSAQDAAQPTTPPTPAGSPVAATNETKEIPLARQLLAGIKSRQEFDEKREKILGHLKKDSPKSFTLNTLALLAQFGDDRDVFLVRKYLNDGDPALVAAAVKALGKLNLDQLLPQLNQLLAHDDPRVKAATLEFFILTDKAGAISHLESMIKSVQPKVKRLALTLLPLLDYSSAEPLLMHLLQFEPNESIKAQAGFMVAANLSQEGIWAIFKACHNDKGKPRDEYQELWKSSLIAAQEVLGKDASLIECECTQRLFKETEDEKKPVPKYAAKKILPQKPLDIASPSVETPSTAGINLAEKLQEFQKPIGITVALVLIILIFANLDFSTPKPRLSNRDSANRNSQASGFETGNKNVPAFSVGSVSPSGFSSGSSSGFSPAIAGAEREIKKTRETFRQENERAMKEFIAEMAKQDINKGFAEFYTNEYCRRGYESVELSQYPEARDYFLKAINDPALSPEARMAVGHSLMSVCYELGDKTTLGLALDKMFDMIPSSDWPPNFSRADFHKQFDQWDRMHEINPDQMREVVSKMAKKCDSFSPEMQQKFMEGFQQMQGKFK
jgi:HEAT repeat protein